MVAAFADFLRSQKLILFPGGMGTELQRRGFNTKLPLWSAEANSAAPHLVEQIHDEYFQAGADIAVTNTFRTTPRTYAKLSQSSDIARDVLKKSVSLAKKSAAKVTDRAVFVAGSFAPLEDCYEPDLVPDDQTLEMEHNQLAHWLAEAGSDFLLAETINHHREAYFMTKAASATGLPFLVSFVVHADGRLLDGTNLEKAIELTDHAGRVGVLLNCRSIDVLSSAFDRLSDIYSGVKGLYANGLGHPHPDQGWIFDTDIDSIEKYKLSANHWLQKGAQIIGGCCGTTPDYIKALATLK
jgi:S-methylmethionine-dependent homocysteine/selenocysteine methylase